MILLLLIVSSKLPMAMLIRCLLTVVEYFIYRGMIMAVHPKIQALTVVVNLRENFTQA